MFGMDPGLEGCNRCSRVVGAVADHTVKPISSADFFRIYAAAFLLAVILPSIQRSMSLWIHATDLVERDIGAGNVPSLIAI